MREVWGDLREYRRRREPGTTQAPQRRARLVDGIRGGDGRGLDGRLPLVRRYVRGTSPLPSPRALRRRTYCTSDAHNVRINPRKTEKNMNGNSESGVKGNVH